MYHASIFISLMKSESIFFSRSRWQLFIFLQVLRFYIAYKSNSNKICFKLNEEWGFIICLYLFPKNHSFSIIYNLRRIFSRSFSLFVFTRTIFLHFSSTHSCKLCTCRSFIILSLYRLPPKTLNLIHRLCFNATSMRNARTAVSQF